MAQNNAVEGTGGDHYIPYEERAKEAQEKGVQPPVVFFTADLSPGGLKKIVARVQDVLGDQVAVKLHTGEPHGPNIIPPHWVKEVMEGHEPHWRVVETNTYYEGDRYTTAEHVQTLRINGWDFWPVDILDADGDILFPIEGGKWFDEMSVGKNLQYYDSFLALTHFKGHTMGGFGGSNKNIGIGCATGRVGKKWIHGMPGNDNPWACTNERFMEHMTESTKAVVDHFKDKIAFVNVMRNMSVSCDCEGIEAEPVVTPNVGILASLDILAVDQACVDIIYAMSEEERKAMEERIETRHGLRQLTYMKELGMGHDVYKLVDIDHDDAIITAADCVKDLIPFDQDNR